jgi:hypothetical protein
VTLAAAAHARSPFGRWFRRRDSNPDKRIQNSHERHSADALGIDPAAIDGARGDSKRPDAPAACASLHNADAIETALVEALDVASEAGRWDEVARLAAELASRRTMTSTAPNVIALDPARRRRR